MDIVFQFGEFTTDDGFWSDFWVNILGTTAAGVITVSLYFYNLEQNRITEEQKKTQFETDRLRYFTAILDKIVKLISAQIERIESFTSELDKEPLYIPMLGMFPLHDIERLSNKIDHAEYYHAFVNQNRDIPEAIKSFDTIYSSIDYFDAQIKKVYDHAQLSLKQDYESKIAFKNSLKIATNKFDDMMLTIIGRSEKKEIFAELDHMSAIYLERMAADPADLKIENEQFFEPALKMIKPFIKKEPPFYTLFLKICEAKNDLEGIIHSNKKLSSGFKIHKNDMSAVLDRLKEHLGVMEKYRSPVQPPLVRKGLLSWLKCIING